MTVVAMLISKKSLNFASMYVISNFYKKTQPTLLRHSYCWNYITNKLKFKVKTYKCYFFSIYILFIKTQLTYYDVTQVRSLKWVNDDSKLVTSGIDGAVYEWGVQTGKRVNESVLKSCQYTCHAVSPQGKHTYAVGSDKTIKEITESSVSWELD